MTKRTLKQFVLLGLGLICFSSKLTFAVQQVKTELISSQGEKIGTAVLVETKKGVKVNLKASKLPPGEHGIHFHEMGKCTPPAFKDAGDHLNPSKKQHGLQNDQGPHEGDLPNLMVKENGKVNTSFTTERVTLKEGKNSLLKEGGTALMIHSKQDDQMSQPSGNSGERIACAAIVPKSPHQK